MFSAAVRASGSPGWFELAASQPFNVEMKARSAEAPIDWIEFNSMREVGVTLADIESIYGNAHRALPSAKNGTTVVFDTTAAEVARGAYVAIQLWSPRADPDAVVSQVQLRYPR